MVRDEPGGTVEHLLHPSANLVIILLALILTGTIGEIVLAYLVLMALRS
jgi:hypothetical protein